TVHRLAEAIRAGRSLEDLDLPRGVRALAGAEKWLREHFEHDPVATVQKVRAPILVVNGGQDIQVAPEHAYRLGAALGDVGHPDYGVKIFP
ncbi:MAG: hypothetical protein GWN99_05745, partial [Gemmatimonadetes bacterium]|nr:hypothetical protein [Gemmatimonadota bacterium]NIS00567.1 hypothetical protein [Gemmatimonadota bacterium]NIT66230.1 hypothetical protein [Gemmatimonadota bacterium]NIV22790.1 hypothetical protein [Gemmatimonadota bacterium]NIW74663.1 hypothetical protein [Gemmatimonadota bacterium]